MINSFENYLKLGKVKRKTKDPQEANALLEQANARLIFAADRPAEDNNASFILQDAYEAMRQAAQSLMTRQGYKPYSHEATISFLRQFHRNSFGEFEIFEFDRFRKLRNDSVYKAVRVSKDDAEQCVAFARNVIKKIENIW